MLNFKTMGQGYPVIILHGLFGMLDNWQKFGKELSKEFSVFLVDQRNHGKSPHLPEMNYNAMAHDLQLFMEENHIYEAYIIGHSMGGKTAMEFALHYPDRVTKLMVVDIAPKRYKPHHQDVFTALDAVPIDQVESRGEVDDVLSTQISDVGTRQFLQKNLSRKKEGGYQWKMNFEAIKNHYEEILSDISINEIYEGPTLFVRGGKSKYISDDDLPLIKERFPAAELMTIANAGHWVHVDAYEELFDITTTFLNKAF